MGRHQRTVTSQGNTMEQYTTLVALLQCKTRLGGPGDVLGALATAKEPLRAEILAAIQGPMVALEGKIEMVAVEVNLFRADFRKVSDKVKIEEGSILELQTEIWDKVTPGRPVRTGSVAHPVSGVDGPDCRTVGDSQLEDTTAQVVATATDHGIEIQQDGTMAVLTAGSAAGPSGELEQGAKRISVHV
ncbi:hypothetical protein NDU88_000197 [Pleurodeles waltl]|uniref:Uncharacterized protein n=1 Tax=Pleurodeles waltl TaxID=8319 RepID=A0AAV7UPA8_PLEWA|nr:hypothetical protein NDU88_000197 [Pleurodeles waltl]